MAGENGADKSKLKEIPLSLIRESKVALRSVQRQSEQYQGLVDSIKARGVLNPILVREQKDPETGELIYGLVDGLQRFNASMDAGRETIPAKVTSLSDAEVLEAQIITNVHKIETKPVEYSKQLMHILAGNPTMTISNLATKLAKSPTWVSERLGLVKLSESIGKLVDEGKINLSNAYALAKLPDEEQANFVERAMTQQPQEFVPAANARVKELRDAKRQGRDASAGGFTPVAHLQKVGDLKSELENFETIPALLDRLNVTDPKEAAKLTLQWVLHLDPVSVELAKTQFEERQRQVEEAKAKRKAEAEAKKAAAATEAAAAV